MINFCITVAVVEFRCPVGSVVANSFRPDTMPLNTSRPYQACNLTALLFKNFNIY